MPLKIAAVFLGLFFVVLSSASEARENINFDHGWKFILGDNAAYSHPEYNDSTWRKLNLPHDWSIEGDYRKTAPSGGRGGYLPTGIGWYRKTFTPPASRANTSTKIIFDGIYMDSTVWLNGHKVGGHHYGYTTFACNLTPYIKPGSPNVIAVRVDNSKEPSARWYHGCGIYAHVHLVTYDRTIHFVRNGTFITTPQIIASAARVHISSAVVLPKSDVAAKIHVRLFASSGKIVAEGEASPNAASGNNATLDINIPQPKLWSPATPNLYRAELSIVANRKVCDTLSIPFGVRTIKWTADKGFLLNGKVTKLHGVCDHEATGVFGAAVSDQIWRDRILQLKAMGCNAIRTAHNPRPPVFYRLCDQLGMMVMDEIFDGWHKKATKDYGARFFKTDWKTDVNDCVIRDRNHPCVVIWSIGNETGKRDVHGITPFIHKLDPTRPTTGGQVIFGVGVAGWNGPGEVPSVLEKWHQKNPKIPIVLTEETHTLQTRGFYRVCTWWRDKGRKRANFPPYGAKQIFFGGNKYFSSSYDNAVVRMTARTCIQRTDSTPWISGSFRWSGYDYLGEGGKWPAREGNFGIVDLAGFPKDDYYLYQSAWRKATKFPMIHLLPGWTHPELKTGTIIPVVAYTNGDSAELFLNGKSLGRQKPRPDLGDIVWNVPWQPGKLRAVSYLNGKPIASTEQITASDPASLKIIREPVKLDDKIAIFTLSAADSKDVFVPWCANKVVFRTDKAAATLLAENGSPIDVTNSRSHERNLFYGLEKVYAIVPTDQPASSVNLFALAALGEKIFPSHTAVNLAFASTNSTPAQIRYTLNGSAPTSSSPEFGKPIVLTATTILRATAYVTGKPVLSLSEKFTRGVPPKVINDKHYATHD